MLNNHLFQKYMDIDALVTKNFLNAEFCINFAFCLLNVLNNNQKSEENESTTLRP
jgi:hypothetical protein